MKRYEYQIMPSGGISYGGPSGYHDDCVIALALANHRRCETQYCGTMVALGGGRRQHWVTGRGRERCLIG